MMSVVLSVVSVLLELLEQALEWHGKALAPRKPCGSDGGGSGGGALVLVVEAAEYALRTRRHPRQPRAARYPLCVRSRAPEVAKGRLAALVAVTNPQSAGLAHRSPPG